MSWFEPKAPLFPEILDLNGRWLGAKPAIIGRERTLTWAEFVAATHRVAGGLRAAGVEPGDRVGVLMDNSVAMAEILFGILRAGAVAVPLNAMVSTDGVDAMLADAAAKALFASSAHQDRWAEAPLALCFGERTAAGWTDFRSWRDSRPAVPPPLALGDGDECNIIYSSGTTGVPKGIVHTHRARLDWFYDLALALRYDSGAVTLMTLGLYSNISWAAMGPTLLAGGTLVIEPGFDAREFLAVVPRHGCTHSAMVPLQYQRILADPDFDRADLSSLRALMCCGSPLDAASKAAIIERFGGVLVELYGLTEGLITTLAPEDARGRLRSVGKPLPGTDLRIIDDDGNELPCGQAGEIVGRGRIVMAGYNNRDDANAEASWEGPDGRRWLRTGDIGYLDDAGFLFLVDRKKDMIISGGLNIYPADIEAVLMTHPAVQEVAVIGVASPRWGESPLAVVVAAEPVEPEALMAWTNERVGKHQRVCGAVLADELPRNANGKVLKRDLRTRHDTFLRDEGTQ